jgi:transcription elongation GreA/GreB family factor
VPAVTASTLPDKRAVCEALRAKLARALEVMLDAAADARRGATHEESRAEGDKDMRSTEQSYLARGHAMRAEELAEELQRFDLAVWRAFGDDDAIGPGALVRASVGDEERIVFVVPHGGGSELEVGGVRVTVVTPSSPVGEALSGKRTGDDFELTVRGVRREWVVEEIA